MCPLVAILNFELRSVVRVQIIHNKKVSFVKSCNGDGDLHIFPIHTKKIHLERVILMFIHVQLGFNKVLLFPR